MKENSRLRKVVHFSKYSNEFYLTENRVCEITVFGFIIFVFIPFRASFSTDLLSSLCKRLLTEARIQTTLSIAMVSPPWVSRLARVTAHRFGLNRYIIIDTMEFNTLWTHTAVLR